MNNNIENATDSRDNNNKQSASNLILRIDNVTRSYSRGFGRKKTTRQVLHNVSFDIHSGEIFCLLGPNGAGKTTTVKIVGTLLAPDGGSVRIANIDAVSNPREARKHVSLLLGGERGFYQRLSALDNLRYFADLSAVPYREQGKRIHDALEQVDLLDKAHDAVQTFSRGMWQRLHIARSLVARTDLMLLDEPTTGLDPENARKVREIIHALRDQGIAILLTTHEMSEAEKLADTVAVINHGNIIAQGSVQQLASLQHIDHVTMYAYDGEVSSGTPSVKEELQKLDGVLWCDVFESHGVLNITIAWSKALSQERNIKIPVDGITRLGDRAASLEETYLAIVQNDNISASNTSTSTTSSATPSSSLSLLPLNK